MQDENKPKRGRPKKSKEVLTVEKAFSILGEALSESLHQQDNADLEVFEKYTHILRSKVQMHTHDFAQSIYKGYKVICEELEK